LKKIFIAYVLLVGVFKFWGQKQFNIYNQEFIQFKDHFVLRNPSFNHYYQSDFVTISHQNLNELSKNIYQTGLNSSIGLQKKSNPIRLNFNLMSEKEGVYLSNNRLLFGLSKTFELSDKSSFALGSSFGGYNFQLDGNQQIDSRSSWVFDASTGFMLRTGKHTFSYSLANLVKQKIVIFNSQNLLVRQHYFSYSYKLEKIKTIHDFSIFLRSPNQFQRISVWIDYDALINERIKLGLIARDISSISPSFGYKFLMDKSDVLLTMAYLLPINVLPEARISRKLEVSVKIIFNKGLQNSKN
jgi:hypothetical protein